MDITLEKPYEVYFKEKNKFVVYDQPNINSYVVDDILGNNSNYSIVFGLPYSGKTFINKHLVLNHGYELLDINEVTKKLKERRNPEDPDSVELVAKDIVDEISSILKSSLNSNENKFKRYCIDNIVGPLFPDIDQVKSLLHALGPPRNFYHLRVDEKELMMRYKRIKLESTSPDPLNENEIEEFNNTHVLPIKIISELEAFSYKTVDIETTSPENITRQSFDSQNGKKLIVVKHDYNNINLENTLVNLATEFQALYINVPYLIYSKFYENKQTAVELKKFYSKKLNLNGNSRELGFEESLYYKYNPIHFDEEVIINLIKSHINNNFKELENTGLVIITGLMNCDLLPKESQAFSLRLKEIKNLFSIGQLHGYIHVTNEAQEIEEQLEEIFLEPPKKPVKVKNPLDVSGDMGDGGNVDDGNMQDNADGLDNMDNNDPGDPNDPDNKKPYNPYNKSWTDYNGQPRNYLQILTKLLNKEVKVSRNVGDSQQVKNAVALSIKSLLLNTDDKEIIYINF